MISSVKGNGESGGVRQATGDQGRQRQKQLLRSLMRFLVNRAECWAGSRRVAGCRALTAAHPQMGVGDGPWRCWAFVALAGTLVRRLRAVRSSSSAAGAGMVDLHWVEDFDGSSGTGRDCCRTPAACSLLAVGRTAFGHGRAAQIQRRSLTVDAETAPNTGTSLSACPYRADVSCWNKSIATAGANF